MKRLNIWLIVEVKYRVMKQRTCYFDKFHNFTLHSFKVERKQYSIILIAVKKCKELLKKRANQFILWFNVLLYC